MAAPELKKKWLTDIKADAWKLRGAPAEIKNDRDCVMAAVTQNTWTLEVASAEMKGDKEVVLAAIANNSMGFMYASEELRNNREVALKAAVANYDTLPYASERLRDDRDLLLAAIRKDWRAAEHASSFLKDDFTFMREGFLHNNLEDAQKHLIMDYASERIQKEARENAKKLGKSLSDFLHDIKSLELVEPSTLRVVIAGKIQQQIEYYLSDGNLKHDTFFHDKISSSDGGWLDITYILTSKKMKELGATKKLVCVASSKSEVFEVDDEISAVRRTDNRPLPPLEPKGNGKGKRKNAKGKGKGDLDNQKKQRTTAHDPEGLFIALKKLLKPIIDQGHWVITRGDSQAHEDENENVSPHLFCKKIPKGSNAMKVIMGQELTPAQAAGGPVGFDCPELLYFRTPEENCLKGWLHALEDDEIHSDDEDDVRELKYLPAKVQKLFDQHGAQQFSYRMDYHDDEENGELATIDGIGVATRSGWAIGFEAAPIYHDP